MEGTATISLDTLDELRAKAEEAETEKKRSDWFVKKLMNCYGFDTEAYDKTLKEINNKRDLTDKQCSKLVREAMVKHLKIVIDPEELKELIQEYIDEEASDEHLDIAKASQKELKQIRVVLKEQLSRQEMWILWISHQIQRRRRISDGSRMERHGRNQPEQQSGSRRQTEGTVQNQRHQREEDVQQRHEFLFKAGYRGVVEPHSRRGTD